MDRMFFFPSVTAEQIVSLRGAQIQCLPFNCEGHPGVVVDRAQAEAAAQLLGLEIAGEDTATGYGGVVTAYTVRIDDPNPRRRRRGQVTDDAAGAAGSPPILRVTTYAWPEMEGRDKMIKIVKDVLLPAVQRNIKVSRSYGSGRGDITCPPGSIGLHLGEGIQQGGSVFPLVLGVRLKHRLMSVMQENSRDDSISLSDDEGVVFAQIVGDHIYILPAIGHHCDDPQEQELFRKILERVVEERTLTPEARIERLRRKMEENRAATRVSYMNLCRSRSEKAIADAQRTIASVERTVAEYEREIVAKVRQLRALQQQLPALQAALGTADEKYGREFDKLLAHPKVVEMEIQGNMLKVLTEVLYCTDPGTKLLHEIGAFRIEINTESGSVHWFNLTRRVHGMENNMQAPHVFNRGHACLGNTSETFPTLIAAHEYAAVTAIAIQFVESVNTNDGAGRHIAKWPVAKMAPATEGQPATPEPLPPPPPPPPVIREEPVVDDEREEWEEDEYDPDDDYEPQLGPEDGPIVEAP